MNKDPFKEYIKQSEPNKRDKGYAWHTAIGLQAVDGLKTSKYLIDTAIKVGIRREWPYSHSLRFTSFLPQSLHLQILQKLRQNLFYRQQKPELF